MTILDLFAGIGGFTLAGHWMGWDTAAFVERDKDCKALELVTTPTARDWKSEKASEQTHARNSRPLSETFGQNTGYRLQPGFVEWMQGYPPGWTHIEPDASSNSETP